MSAAPPPTLETRTDREHASSGTSYRGRRLVGIPTVECLSHCAAMQGLRKRRTAEEAAPDEPSSSAVVETLKALDVYPKTLDDFKERTGSGAVISLVSCTAIFLLVISELRAYLTPTTVDHLYVDTTRGERIKSTST